jgi:hypothetical protein
VDAGKSDDPSTASRTLFYDDINDWSTYFAYNDMGRLSPAIWTSADNSGLENVGDAVLSGDPDDMLVIIEPCAGFFEHSKAQAVDLMMVGIVREWDAS